MIGWLRFHRRIVAALAVLLAPLTGGGCAAAVVPLEARAAASADDTADAEREVCLVGRPTGEGVECQAFRAGDGRLYTLIGDLGSLAGDGDVCVCGAPVEMSTCMQGTTVTVTRIGPPDACP